jgi:hypothetical protein
MDAVEQTDSWMQIFSFEVIFCRGIIFEKKFDGDGDRLSLDFFDAKEALEPIRALYSLISHSLYYFGRLNFLTTNLALGKRRNGGCGR